VPGTLDLIKNDLVNSIPDILEQPGHFVVAKGINNGIVQINDPYYNRSSLADYGNTFISVNKFSPSHTDLSYILVVYSPDVSLQINDSNHNYVGQYYEGAHIIDANNTSKNSGGPIMLYYVSKPNKDDYLLDVSSSVGSSKKLEIYLYDKAGNSFKYDKYLYLKNNETKTISLHYDPKSVGTGKATYGSLRKDLNFALRKKEIQTDLYAYIISKSVIAETEQKLNKKQDELVTLTQMQENLDKSFGSKVFDPSYAKILNDINYLQTNL
jgi:hypothetical protein